MKLLIDASALVAVIRNEPEANDLLMTMEHSDTRLTNGVALWEAARALARDHLDGLEGGLFEVERYCAKFAIAIVPIAAAEAKEAVRAQLRYGNGAHSARLNMGDCFAYAGARTNGAALLYKSDDFAQTDLA